MSVFGCQWRGFSSGACSKIYLARSIDGLTKERRKREGGGRKAATRVYLISRWMGYLFVEYSPAIIIHYYRATIEERSDNDNNMRA